MPSTKSNSKLGRVATALALGLSVQHVASAPAVNLTAITKTVKCIQSSAYGGPYMAPFPIPKFVNGLNGKFMFISDIHIDESYLEGSDPATQCHRVNTVDATKNRAGKYGALNSICDTPQGLMDETFQWIKDNHADVDFVIYTGDSARHDRDTKQPRQSSEVLNEHKIIVDKVLQTFDLTKTKFIPTWGNNDQFKYGEMAGANDPIIGNVTEIWKPLGLGLETKPEWNKGGYFSYQVAPGLTVFSLNSMLLFNTNKFSSDCATAGSPGGDMLNWLTSQLDQLRAQGKKAYVMQHVPPQDASGKKLYWPGCDARYTNVLGSYADVILASFHGHTNSDYITAVYTNNTDNPLAGPFFAKTITDKVPSDLDFDNSCILHITSQGPAIIPANNPAVRVYNYSTSRWSFGALIDYIQYFSDLLQDNSDGKVTYSTEYTSTRSYGLWNLSPFAWTQALKDWATGNSTAFGDYVKFRFVNPENAPTITY
ncbi:Endopolyphosphatase [Borealophlyctis nickersoniae]|nr:Endopolyphosphatase [Borealophlyctis nickersoniae]